MGSPFQYGGQAVIEGVMMRGPDTRAIAVRRPDQTIIVDEKKVGSLTKRVPVLKWPLVRGVVVLIEALVLGIEALTFSASQATGEEEELTPWEIIITVGIALALAVLLFAFLPVWAAHLLNRIAPGAFVQNLIEGFFRIAIFLAYVVAIGKMADIKRVFQYHGAEHKVINAYEAGDQLAVERVQQYSTLHPRCGTSFLLIVLVISILIFSLLGEQVLWWRILSRVLLLPVIAGISYELVKISGKYYSKPLCRVLIAPGMWLQKLTTGPPDDGQVEVALAAFGAVAKESEK
ncbi:MAG: hypothetical protein BWY80_00244 [Firmicutes bacterium ADurb.Bin456]|nr:MAG: hypothetical protein BWY80_00244 [Firmicutes bacterium ADurb.Bin456]